MDFPIETKTYRIDHIEDCIFQIHFFAGELQLTDYEQALGVLYQYREENKEVFIISSQDSRFRFSKETWEFIKDEFKNDSVITAEAIVLKELHSRLLAKFYLKMVRNINKTKILSSKQLGLELLRKQSTNTKNKLGMGFAI